MKRSTPSASQGFFLVCARRWLRLQIIGELSCFSATLDHLYYFTYIPFYRSNNYGNVECGQRVTLPITRTHSLYFLCRVLNSMIVVVRAISKLLFDNVGRCVFFLVLQSVKLSPVLIPFIFCVTLLANIELLYTIDKIQLRRSVINVSKNRKYRCEPTNKR